MIIAMDKVKHAVLCMIVAMWRTDYAIVMALTIELTQAEAGSPSIREMLRRLTSRDTMWDLVADAIGIIAGTIIRIVLFNN